MDDMSTITANPDLLRELIAGGLAGALLGDAMGCVTEQLTPAQIANRYGRVTTLLAPADGTFAHGRLPGELTDDGLLTLSVFDAIITGGGTITIADVAQLLLDWACDPDLLARFAGPSSRRAIELLQAGADPYQAGAPDPMNNDLRISNGAAMKAAPAGWASPDDQLRAALLATRISAPTHNSDISYSGAAAIATAVSSAAAGAEPLAILAAARAGCEEGLRLAAGNAVAVPGASISARLLIAGEIAAADADEHHRFTRLAAVFGNGLPVTEAVPMAIGAFLIFPEDPMRMLTEIVNVGGDADTIASIAGAIAGTHCGITAFPTSLIAQLEKVNSLSIRQQAEKMAHIVQTKDVRIQ